MHSQQNKEDSSQKQVGARREGTKQNQNRNLSSQIRAEKNSGGERSFIQLRKGNLKTWGEENAFKCWHWQTCVCGERKAQSTERQNSGTVELDWEKEAHDPLKELGLRDKKNPIGIRIIGSDGGICSHQKQKRHSLLRIREFKES